MVLVILAVFLVAATKEAWVYAGITDPLWAFQL
jgi:hypothetical protein